MPLLKNQNVTRIRLAKIGDARQLALMARQEIEHGLSWGWTPDRIRAAIRRHDCVVLTAVTGNKVSGFALMQSDHEMSHLCLLAVARGMRRRGIARQLIELLLDVSRQYGNSAMQLETRMFNLEARALYRSMGFRLVAHTANYYENGEAAAVMALELGAAPGVQPSAPAFCA